VSRDVATKAGSAGTVASKRAPPYAVQLPTAAGMGLMRCPLKLSGEAFGEPWDLRCGAADARLPHAAAVKTRSLPSSRRTSSGPSAPCRLCAPQVRAGANGDLHRRPRGRRSVTVARRRDDEDRTPACAGSRARVYVGFVQADHRDDATIALHSQLGGREQRAAFRHRSARGLAAAPPVPGIGEAQRAGRAVAGADDLRPRLARPWSAPHSAARIFSDTARP